MLSKIVTSKGFVMFATFEFPSKTPQCQSVMDLLTDLNIPRTPKSATKKTLINGKTKGYFIFTPYRKSPIR